MSSYLIVGPSRGIGFELVRQLSENPANVVIGLARSVTPTKEKIAAELGRPNIHIVYADLDDYKTFPDAATEVSRITGGRIDYFIGSAGMVHDEFYHMGLAEQGKEPEKLEKSLLEYFRINVVSYAHLINAFMPLVLQGSAKKVVVLSSGLGDVDLTRESDGYMAVAYSVSKAALNMIIAKFSAEYREEGVLFLSISPGVVDTNEGAEVPESLAQCNVIMAGKLMKYAPEWKGPLTPEQSVKAVLSVVDNASIEGGNAGDFLSHWGNKTWV